ncbi:hypothetical protein K438DRAFT_1768169 [Mycena galopus ATCC 62051]|nr:hypothetical protein K438DRAFT_1768169 [Mycena galopus ATCC 62051]
MPKKQRHNQLAEIVKTHNARDVKRLNVVCKIDEQCYKESLSRSGGDTEEKIPLPKIPLAFASARGADGGNIPALGNEDAEVLRRRQTLWWPGGPQLPGASTCEERRGVLPASPRKPADPPLLANFGMAGAPLYYYDLTMNNVVGGEEPTLEGFYDVLLQSSHIIAQSIL